MSVPTAPAVPAIDIEQVRFAWGNAPALLQIDQLQIARGERVFLRGPSGSGKSTLLGLIGGVLVPSGGQVRLLGTNIAALGAAGRDRFRGEHLGFVFQMFNLIPYLTVIENVLLPTQFSRARRERAGAAHLRDEAGRLLAALGLGGELLDRAVTQLSIGQQQRVAAARALLGKPDIVIADEPTSALDADARSSFLELLMQECRTQGATLLFVSHDTALQMHFDRVLSMAEINGAGAPR
ncbi:MAG: ABC transporter ATP-binding protein [Steroidobacteraceae bacterium]